MSKRRKPSDPGKLVAQTQERRNIEAEKARLAAMGASYTLDRAGRIMSAWRSNVFNLLLERGTITPNHHDAAYSLSLSWAAWKGLDGKPETFGEVVDGGQGAAELVTDRMLRAGRDVSHALESLTVQSRTILRALMVATVEEDRPMAWRGIVARCGVTVRDQQPKAVVAALEELRAYYEEPGRAAA